MSKGPKGLWKNFTFRQPVPTEILKNSYYAVVSHSLFSRVLGKLSTNYWHTLRFWGTSSKSYLWNSLSPSPFLQTYKEMWWIFLNGLRIALKIKISSLYKSSDKNVTTQMQSLSYCSSFKIFQTKSPTMQLSKWPQHNLQHWHHVRIC